MQVRIKATKIELTPSIKAYIEEKMGKIRKHLGDIQPLNFDFEVEMTTAHHHKGDIFRAEANLEIPGGLLRVEKTESDLYQAIDSVEKSLALVVKKQKEKNISKERRAREE